MPAINPIPKFKEEPKLKTLIDYKKEVFGYTDPTILSYLTNSDISTIMAYIISREIKEVYMNQSEIYGFIHYYDNLLPHDWDQKSFRGVTIHRVRH